MYVQSSQNKQCLLLKSVHKSLLLNQLVNSVSVQTLIFPFSHWKKSPWFFYMVFTFRFQISIYTCVHTFIYVSVLLAFPQRVWDRNTTVEFFIWFTHACHSNRILISNSDLFHEWSCSSSAATENRIRIFFFCPRLFSFVELTEKTNAPQTYEISSKSSGGARPL